MKTLEEIAAVREMMRVIDQLTASLKRLDTDHRRGLIVAQAQHVTDALNAALALAKGAKV